MDEGTPVAEAGRYAAFLSYSHKDSAQARWLHRRLEGYRIPRRLVGAAGEHGPVPARLTPIFRDREELPAAGDLSERIRAALADSRSLIVLCSPNSAASPWVAKEIEAFRALHPGRPAYAAIVEGEPGECFPACLIRNGAEPLAADLRPRRDGRRLGLLKLVAGLTGIGLDALVQRDAGRRMRRVTAVTAAALVAVLAMAVMTTLALQARAEAQRQRAGAEGLVEFMLTDLRTKLKGVGRLDALEIANRRALSFYRHQPMANLPPESLELRARILHAMGEDAIAAANLPRALDAFREAHAATAAALSRDPTGPKAIFAHGQSEFWIGRVHEIERQWPEAQDHYRRYADAAARLIAIDPANADYALEMGYGAVNLGVVELHGLGRPDSALPYFRSAAEWFARVVRARPGDPTALRELANADNFIAETFYVRKLWPQALAAYREQYRVTEQLVSLDRRDTDSLYRLAIVERALALTARKTGAGARAQLLFGSAAERMRFLTSRDPANADWLLMKTKIDCDLLKGAAAEMRLKLRRDIDSARAALLRQRNPRVADVSRCLGH